MSGFGSRRVCVLGSGVSLSAMHLLATLIQEDGISIEGGPVGLGNTNLESLDFLKPAEPYLYQHLIREREVNHKIDENIMPRNLELYGTFWINTFSK